LAELFRPSEHEPLAGAEWSEDAAEQAIAAIVADAEAAFDGERWPFHPADEIDDGPNAVYLGVAGMAWALHELGPTGERSGRTRRAISPASVGSPLSATG
jgi:hypothetical protein